MQYQPYFKARSAIRQTWANISELPRNVKVVFIIGQADNEKQQLKIKGESNKYGDIIQESFVDTYQNLTIKSLMLLKWFKQNCHQTQYVMKTDDDMYINLPKLNDLVKANQDPYLLVGNLRRNVAPIRRSQSKWHVPYHMFPERHYPNYLVGIRLYVKYFIFYILYFKSEGGILSTNRSVSYTHLTLPTICSV